MPRRRQKEPLVADAGQVRLPLSARPALDIVRVHGVSQDRQGAWSCEACDFWGDRDQAVRHAVAEQWDQSGWTRTWVR